MKSGQKRRNTGAGEKEEQILSFGQIEGVLCGVHGFRSCSCSMSKTVIWERVSMIFNNFTFSFHCFSDSFLCALLLKTKNLEEKSLLVCKTIMQHNTKIVKKMQVPYVRNIGVSQPDRKCLWIVHLLQPQISSFFLSQKAIWEHSLPQQIVWIHSLNSSRWVGTE